MKIVRRDDSSPFVTKDGSIIRSILDLSNSSAKNQSLAEAILQPGGSTEPHCHPKSEEIYYVLSGNGKMTVGKDTADIAPLTGILIPPGVRHQIRNTGATDLVFLCCCSPPYQHEDTVIG